MRSTGGVPGRSPRRPGAIAGIPTSRRGGCRSFASAPFLAILAGLGLMGSNWARSALRPKPIPPAGTWFAPYVDTTLTPTYPFESASDQPARQVVLGFVVADPQRGMRTELGGGILARTVPTRRSR